MASSSVPNPSIRQVEVRIAILADIHGNLEALDAVLADAGSIDAIWCLGDLVGYGANPNECIDRLQQYQHVAIAGNHDLAAIGRIPLDAFNLAAAAAARWTAAQLTPAHRAYLASLPLIRVEGAWTLVHGSPREPIWEYVLTPQTACALFRFFETAGCLIGHTHVPALFRVTPTGYCTAEMLPDELPLTGDRLIVNPGGVGQPRDGDPRASYVILDDEQRVLVHRRVPYDIATAQQKIRGAGLPASLAARLEIGV